MEKEAFTEHCATMKRMGASWALNTVYMGKEDLKGHIEGIADEVVALFCTKNERYGGEDSLSNFREMVPALQMWVPALEEINGMYLANEFLAEKHRVTMLKHGIYDPKFEESALDRIAYLLIAVAMRREWDSHK